MPTIIPKEAPHSRSPCAAAKHPRVCQARQVPHEVVGQYLPKRPRVLIAEDHTGVAKSVCRVLALDCDVVGTIADGSAVLEAAQRLEPDVIVVDLNLPCVHGLRRVVRSRK